MLDKTGKIFDNRKFRYEGDNIFVFKVDQERYFCFFTKDSKIIITNVYRKKTQKISKSQKSKALKARKRFFNLSNRGMYYDKEH